MIDFTCDFSQPPKAFPHFWEHTVGSGHALLALRADWQAQMLRCHNELGFQHVRFHGCFPTTWALSSAKKKNYFILSSMRIRFSIFFCL